MERRRMGSVVGVAVQQQLSWWSIAEGSGRVVEELFYIRDVVGGIKKKIRCILFGTVPLKENERIMFSLSNVRKSRSKTNPPVLHISSTELACELNGGDASGGSGSNHLTVNEAVRLHRSSTASDLHPVSEKSVPHPRNSKPEAGNRLDLWNFLTSAKLTSSSAPSTPLVETLDSSEFLHPRPVTPVTVVKGSRFMRKSSSSMMNSEGGLKDLAHPAHSEILRAHSAVTIKLVKTGLLHATHTNTRTNKPFISKISSVMYIISQLYDLTCF